MVPEPAPLVGGGCGKINASNNICSGPCTLASHVEERWDIKEAL